jgi:hypothetical protein
MKLTAIKNLSPPHTFRFRSFTASAPSLREKILRLSDFKLQFQT